MALPLPHQNMVPQASVSVTEIPVGIPDLGGKRKSSADDRLPQWGYHETKEFICVRAELEKDFVTTKRNKNLWELIAAKMKERGFRRTADQCKCKWKNLVNRYKGKEVNESENGRNCPFFEELDAIFKERAKNMDRMLIDNEVGPKPKKKGKRGPGRPRKYDPSDDETEDDEEDEEDQDGDESRKKARLMDKKRYKVTAEKQRASTMQEVLEEYLKSQQGLEQEWRETVEKKEQERRMREAEWREAIERLEHERLTREAAWREREEQRHAREEARALKREELFSALIARLLQSEREEALADPVEGLH
eukprot:jgi/Mesen1/6804/ME000035S06181